MRRSWRYWMGFWYFVVSTSCGVSVQTFRDRSACESVRSTVEGQLQQGEIVTHECRDSSFIYPIPVN